MQLARGGWEVLKSGWEDQFPFPRILPCPPLPHPAGQHPLQFSAWMQNSLAKHDQIKRGKPSVWQEFDASLIIQDVWEATGTRDN